MNSSVRVGSLGPLTVVRAGCELERPERSSSQLLVLLALDGDRALSIDELAGSQWARAPQSPTPRILAAGVSARGAGTFYDVWQTDGDLFTLRAHGDTCCAGRDVLVLRAPLAS